ncbi:MAG TPA: FAD-dependent oxidoreductase [Gemmatimonadota bacterium]|nr:FAD-dependent oxidoreductase [Gemmatimonadota bacterium]
MHTYDYLIVGGGMAADAAVGGIREVDPEGSVGLVGGEEVPPYDRPPLSKGLWKGGEEADIWRSAAAEGAELHLGRRVVAIDRQARTVQDDAGETYGYGRLLLATGGRPRLLPGAPEGVIHYRTVRDYERLRDLAGEGRRFVVIGGGFIGSEIAAALTMADAAVTVVFPESDLCARLFPPGLARFVSDHFRERGVGVRDGASVTGITRDGDGYEVALDSGDALRADGVVVGIGIVPETELASEAGLETGDGIVVDAHLRTSDPEIFAAGDVAAFPHPALRRRMRIEHEDAANTMGRQAGRNMAGADEPYEHVPLFYSDLFDLGYEAVGRADARLDIVEDWTDEFGQGVLYYLDEGRVEGVLLWNTWGQADAARGLLRDRSKVLPGDLAGRLPE